MGVRTKVHVYLAREWLELGIKISVGERWGGVGGRVNIGVRTIDFIHGHVTQQL